MKVNAADLYAIAPGADANIVASIVNFQSYLEANGIVSAKETAYFLGQVAVETAGFNRLEENLFYTSEARLMAVWPNRFPTKESATPYVRNPRKLANLVYGGRFGNVEPDDGYDYRGSGAMMTTFRANFIEVEKVTGSTIKCERNPGLLRAMPEALIAAVIYWRVRNLNTYVDRDDIVGLTKAIQGGAAALGDRTTFTKRALDRFAGFVEPAVKTKWLRSGMSGEIVKSLQLALQKSGHYVGGKIDGDYGPGTERAVMDFQRGAGLIVDGVVGDATARKLGITLPDAPIVAPVNGNGPPAPELASPVQPDATGVAGILAVLLKLVLSLFGKGQK